jgi:hypothetical protein
MQSDSTIQRPAQSSIAAATRESTQRPIRPPHKQTFLGMEPRAAQARRYPHQWRLLLQSHNWATAKVK